MKKTLFLCALFGLAAYANAATDCMMPQTIINVCADATVTQTADNETGNVTVITKCESDSGMTVSELMTQTAQEVKGNRPAVVKDGQGTLEITGDVGNLDASLVVREGTLSITNGATVTTMGRSGNNLAVGGINATMVLSDGAKYTYNAEKASSTSSVNIGGIDGDGTLMLTGASTLETRQSIFTGTAAPLPIPTGDDPYWEVGPHQGGSYAKVDGSSDNEPYRVSNNAAGFSNQTSHNGSLAGTAVVRVEDGSTLSAGAGLYVGNTQLTVDNATVKSAVKAATESSFIGSSEQYGPSSNAIVSIVNGGLWDTQQNMGICFSYYEGERSDVTISGKNSSGTASRMQTGGVGYFGSNVTSQSVTRILEGGQASFGEYLYARGTTNASHRILVDGEGSLLDSSLYFLYGATSIDVRNGALMQGSEVQAIRSDIALSVSDGGRMNLSEKLTLTNGATLKVSGAGAVVYAVTAGMKSGASVVISDGAGVNSDAWSMNDSELTLQNATMDVASNLFVNSGSQLRLEGNSSLGSVENSYVLVSAATMDVAEESVVNAYYFSIGDGRLTNHGTMSVGTISCSTANTAIDNYGEITAKSTSSAFSGLGSVLTNYGTMKITTFKLSSGGSLINDGTISATNSTGAKLTVAKGSTLDNNGVINATTVVGQGGTLKGSGNMGSTTVQGTLVVGNSPGAPVFEELLLGSTSETVFSIAGAAPATAELSGWENAVYSQITITDGTLTLNEGARFVIEFGGALLYDVGGHQDFTIDLDLVNAAEAITLSGDELDALLGNTTFRIAADSPTGGADWSVNVDFSQTAYSLTNDDTTLRLHVAAHLVPEPATATLSLLALAALASRRRRI